VTPAGEIRLPGLPYPVQVQVNSKGEILALDGRLRRIVRISPDGALEGTVFPPPAAGADPVIPRAFRIDGRDDLYVLDIFQDRIHVLDPGGRPLREIGFPPGVSYLSDLAVDGHGSVFALQSEEKRVYAARKGEAVLAPLTEPMTQDLAYPTALAADGAGRIAIADQNGGGIVFLGPDGSFRGRQAGYGWKEGSLRYPSGLCFGQEGLLFVADRENSRVQVFALSE
jgi:sugar lactone lactonase YvrE